MMSLKVSKKFPLTAYIAVASKFGKSSHPLNGMRETGYPPIWLLSQKVPNGAKPWRIMDNCCFQTKKLK